MGVRLNQVLIDWLDLHSGLVIALATVLLVLVTAVYVRITARMVSETARQSTATKRLAEEMTEDRELSVRPLLVCIFSGRSEVRDDGATYMAPAVVLRNIGSGPAINVVVWARFESKIFQAHGFSLAVGEVRPNPEATTAPAEILTLVAMSNHEDDPGEVLAGDAMDADLIVYCGDQLGSRLRFNLRRSVDPPIVWRRHEDHPRWAHAWIACGADLP